MQGEVRETTLGSIATIFDGPHATPTRTDVGPYFLNIASLNSGRLDLDQSDHVDDADFAKWTKRVTPKGGDLLFSYETRLGEAALMPADVEACLGRRMALLRFDAERVDPRFFLYYYLSPEFQRLIESRTIYGATVNRIALSTMADWTVKLPDLNEQQAIAEVLGALDDKIAANRKLAATADRLADVHFAANVQRLTSAVGSPNHQGRELTIAELARTECLTFGDGYRTKRTELADHGFRIIRVADISGGEVRPTGSDYVTYDRRSNIGVKAAEVGDIVLTTKGTVGRLAVYEESEGDAVYSPQVCFFRVNENPILDRAYLRRWFSSSDFVAQSSYRKGNTDMADYINLADLGSMKLSLPAIEDQRALARVLEPLHSLISSLRKESRTLSGLRDALLPRLMSGELRVRDAEEAL